MEKVAAGLRTIYGPRLRAAVLYGSRARGHPGPESDPDMAVVLDSYASLLEELERISAVSWPLSLEHCVTIRVLLLTAAEYEKSLQPVIVRIREEGIPV